MVNSQHFLDSSKLIPVAVLSAGIGAGIATAGLAAAAGISAYFARQVVVPPKRPYDSMKILGVGYSTTELEQNQQPTSVTLEASPANLAPGIYGLYFDGGQGYAQIGKILSYNPTANTVVREVLRVLRGNLAKATRGKLSGVVSPTPQDAGFAAHDISLDLAVGSAPAWLIHPHSAGQTPGQEPSKTWAIMIHGMGATRAETLRALETTQNLGLTSLHLAYRNDREAPPSDDGRYGLGFTEWEDVETAIDYALAHGAQNVVLFGWSMGGAIALQALDRASNRNAIRALVLDGPAVDWLELISYHTQLKKLPLRVGELAMSMISKPVWNLFTGLKKPIHLDRLSWTRRAGDIKKPTLIIHSLDDTFVPAEPSRTLSRKSRFVDFVPFTKAMHTREWNVDPHKWEQTVTSWLPQHIGE